MDMKSKFLKVIEEHNLFQNNDSILLGISGGPDSLAMLDLFLKIKKIYSLEIAAAHLDHSFREESKAEADFVEAFCFKAGIDFFRKRVDLPEIIAKKSISAEAAARRERFDFFSDIIAKNNYNSLALAHHQDDQAETVLLNLFRGSALKGLGGIEYKSDYNKLKIIHPMLDFTKKEIKCYCEKRNLNPCIDSSNKKNIYSRNLIRNKIFPLVEKEINPKVKEIIARNSRLIAEEDDFINKIAEKEFGKVAVDYDFKKIILDLNKLNLLDKVLKRRIYRKAYKKLNKNLNDLYFEHILEIEKLLNNKDTGRGIDLPAEIRVEISYSKLIFFKNNFYYKNSNDKKMIKINKKNKFGNFQLELEIKSRDNFSFNNNKKNVAAFDYDKISFPIYMRNRQDGDKIKPLGMSGHKKIKDIFIDKKIPRFKREQSLLIVDSETNIIWLAPYKLSDEFKITNNTKKVLIIKLI